MPRWMMVTAAVLAFLVLVVALALTAALEEPPEHARLPALQERFGEQIAALAELARTVPSHGCAGQESPPDPVPEAERMEAWWEDVEAASPVFDHPALLGAEIVFRCGVVATTTIDVKRFDNPEGIWSGALLRPAPEYPAATVWHHGDRTLIRYEDLLTVPERPPRSIRLTFDPESMAPG